MTKTSGLCASPCVVKSMPSTQDVRRGFLQYFKRNGHTIVPSSPVVPHDDPTLLFTNAGMNQFKDVFLGRSKRDYTRATTSQKCVRVGGKHNDLDNVGHTSRHLTFFEMLGNFSFGDYFKEQAIAFAWQMATEVFQFPPEKVWPTIFRDDDEAFELWTKWVPADRIVRFGEKENFWAMGDTGPCGPCSELLFDRGPAYGPATHPHQDTDGERFLEFWNLVFMQYNRDASGVLTPLPKQSIDTGAGLERVVSLIQGKDNVFETDLLFGLINQVEELSGKRYESGSPSAAAFRVIADHIRTLAFAIADGAQPSNTERGYVLRKILRRAVRYGRQLGLDQPFLARMLPRLTELMGADYRELIESQARTAEILTVEEEAFLRTLRRGGNLLHQVIDRARTSTSVISGEDAFKLKDTYGLPLEEITLLAKDAALTVDLPRFEALDAEAREKSRAAHKGAQVEADAGFYDRLAQELGATEFLGYGQLRTPATIRAILVEGRRVSSLSAGQTGVVVLDRTPFYAEMGGQVGDQGWLRGTGIACVQDTKTLFTGLVGHQVHVEAGVFHVGEEIEAAVDPERRRRIAANHTATHLLHWALNQVLGEHIRQAGSVVDAERLRFDFSHHKAVTQEELRKVEDLVNHQIVLNLPVATYEIPYEQAQARADIKQFFGEKYGNMVRVVDLSESKELCGGTHAARSGDIGLCLITKESSVAAGVRRLEAVTGAEAIREIRSAEDAMHRLAGGLKCSPAQLPERMEKLLEEQRELAQQLRLLQQQERSRLTEVLLGQQQHLGDLSFIAQEVAMPINETKELLEAVSQKMGPGLLLLAAREPGRVQIFVRSAIPDRVSAVQLIKAIAHHIEGTGGGKADFAQAGGKKPEGISQALQGAEEFFRSQLASSTP
ncbi:MAG: alanine--tRNA ligase [Chlamydiia bacterium]